MTTATKDQLSRTQRAIVITGPGGPDVLQLVTQDVPRPGPDEILIEVRAAGVNRHDCHQRRTGPGHTRTDVPGLEVAGTIVETGAHVPASRVGELVCALIDGGGYAEFAVAPLSLVLPVPSGMDVVAAAGLPEALFTTWFNMFDLAGLKPGETVLIHGGTSGVGSLAIQALTALGYAVFTTCGSDEKCRAAGEFGAVAALNYHSPDLAAAILEASRGKKVDVILDMSAGAHLDADLEVLASGGRILHLSGGGGKALPVPLIKLMAKQGWITGSLLRPTPLARKARVAERLRQDLWPKLGTAVHPIIAQTFGLESAAAAHAEMERNQHIGKILLLP